MSLFFRFFLGSAILFAACGQKANLADDAGAALIHADSIKKHVAVLSADSFTGRMPFTEGETKTIAYLRQQFEAMGLEPGNGSSYFQEVPLVNILAMASPEMKVEGPKGSFSLKGFDDYIMWTNKTDENISLNGNELVFAGYGVVAPEYGWNDYEGLDVKDKVVLVMVNDPGFWVGDTTLFKGKTMTYYGRWTYKFEEAARQGAKGCLIIHNTAAAGYPFAVAQNNHNTSRLQLDNRGKDVKLCDVNGWVPESIGKRLLTEAGLDTSLLVKANQKGFKAVPTGLKLSASMKVQANYDKSHNVIAKITGSTRPDEVVIYTAHWDHLGFGRPDASGDSIYNGAYDNATGTAGLLELARAFKSLKQKPERTIVFLAVTAEEQGLLGSAYYAGNPVYPVAQTLANINMDGLNQFTGTKDIVVVGRGQSDLEDLLLEEVKKADRYVSFETNPEAGSYYRSDHFNFAKVGVPALYTKVGIDVIGKGKEYGKKLHDDYTARHYHKPSDAYDANWTMEGAVSDLRLLFSVGQRIAAAQQWPKWKEGSEFRGLRK